MTISACDQFDDIDVALKGLHPSDVWITRLRAYLPASSLGSVDLRIEPAPEQATASAQHHTKSFTDPSYDPCPKAPVASASPQSDGGCVCTTRVGRDREAFGTYVLVGVTTLLAFSMLRRRKR
jgi:hypothetical protein